MKKLFIALCILVFFVGSSCAVIFGTRPDGQLSKLYSPPVDLRSCDEFALWIVYAERYLDDLVTFNDIDLEVKEEDFPDLFDLVSSPGIGIPNAKYTSNAFNDLRRLVTYIFEGELQEKKEVAAFRNTFFKLKIHKLECMIIGYESDERFTQLFEGIGSGAELNVKASRIRDGQATKNDIQVGLNTKDDIVETANHTMEDLDLDVVEEEDRAEAETARIRHRNNIIVGVSATLAVVTAWRFLR